MSKDPSLSPVESKLGNVDACGRTCPQLIRGPTELLDNVDVVIEFNLGNWLGSIPACARDAVRTVSNTFL